MSETIQRDTSAPATDGAHAASSANAVSTDRIADAFASGKAFIGFLTAGDPSLKASEGFIGDLAAGGADIIEVGIPFSDPIAEGPVIQQADLRALKAGATTDDILALVSRVRHGDGPAHDTALVFMTYYNVVFGYGVERFLTHAAEAGIDGIILPDLPYEEQGEVRPIADRLGIRLISMIAPTSHERIRMIASHAEGFLYVVSSLGVTGVRSTIDTDLSAMMDVVRKATTVPAAIGFGIATPDQAKQMAGLADGAIVGSAIVRMIAEHGEAAGPYLRDYTHAMKAAVQAAG